MTLLLLFATLAIGISFLCSLLEASLLSLPRSYIESLVDKGSRTGRTLQRMKQHIDRPLAAILTLNTVAHTGGAAGVGAQAAVVFGSFAVGIASAVMTLLILVVSEIIPKTLGAAHARRLAGFTALTIHWMIVLCLPLILVLEWSHLLQRRRTTEAMSRTEMHASIGMGRQAGAITPRESRIMRNLLALQRVKVADVLTPRTVVFALPHDDTVECVMTEQLPLRFARIPIYKDSLDHVIGYVIRPKLYEAHATGGGKTAMAELAEPIEFIPALASVIDGLELFLEKRQHIAVAVDEYGGTEGIITLEDALETLLGVEIVDETDATPDMQALAKRVKSQHGERG